MKTIKIENNFNAILRVTKNRFSFKRKGKVLVVKKKHFFDCGFGATITLCNSNFPNNIVLSKEDFYKFKKNDIVEINKDGIIFLWEYANDDNCFFLTDACSCNCIMCPQPPKSHVKENEERVMRVFDLIPKSYKNGICITGGEPTLLGDFYLDLIKKIRKKFPNNFLITLTNGKTFSNFDFLNKFHDIQSNSVVAVSICGDVDFIHDNIVRTPNSFYLTHQGIYNLAKAGEQIELRFVISRLNYRRLPYLADYIYKNYPFVVHIALMGLEYTGNADANYELLKINPLEYSDFLVETVQKLNRYGMNVSIYNVPLCLIDKKIRKYAAKSISKWKNDYPEICQNCLKKEKCCGFFTTSSNHPYENITPIIDE